MQTKQPRLSAGARALALEIAAECRAEWGFASDILARAFRAHRELPSGDRRRISEAVYGLIRWDRRLDAIIAESLSGGGGAGAGAVAGERFTAGELSPVVRDQLKLLIYEIRDGLVPVDVGQAEALALVRGRIDLSRAADDDAGLGHRKDLERAAVKVSYPTWMIERFAADLGLETALAMADAMNRRAPMAVRVNTLRISREALIARLAEENVTARPSVLAPDGLVLETRVNAFGLSAFRDGLFEVMDEGSQLVAELVAPPPGGRVLDACAGAGGKTLALGSIMAGKGRLLAVDVDGRKLEELRRRARRAGLNSVEARAFPDGIPKDLPVGAFHRVLVDAPCSGLGTLRRNPEARWRLTPDSVAGFPARQVSLLVTYAPYCNVGGRLIYATCTVFEDENERVIERFLAERDDFVRVPIKEIWGRERVQQLGGGDGQVLRLYPHVNDTDGFFATVLRRIR
ncbi:MAG: rRNA (cytosine967-C5)-methyltransferase [Myxococcales bacterium]|nr:rRNA (cytosine967-C5)-methyltransferase [Myxococcales bacterium]